MARSSPGSGSFETVFIDRSVLPLPLTQTILRRLRGVPCEIVKSRRPIMERLASSVDPVGEGKKLLYLTRRKGPFIKRCPCTPHYLGCNYFIINSVLNCPLDCSYCILQAYLGPSPITIHVNLDDLWRELDRFLAPRKGRFLRLGTGELADSLALEPLIWTSRLYIDYFKNRPHAFFEFKTKTARIETLLRSRPPENVVISWTLNSERVAAAEEIGAPPVAERLEAAREAARRGFSVGFHFDPLIDSAAFEEEYGPVIEGLLRSVPARRVRWLSLGSLRFPRALKAIIEKRFPTSSALTGELVPGRDGKLRYFKPRRLDLYRKFVALLKIFGGEEIPLYFCMEDPEIWESVLKIKAGRAADVEARLSPRRGDS